MMINRFSSIYSHQNAIGLLIGTGTIGPYLSNKQSDINTYISWNFGKSWTEVNNIYWLFLDD